MYPLDVIVTFLQLVYEHACPFLTLPQPSKSHQPIDLVTYCEAVLGIEEEKQNDGTKPDHGG